MSSSNPTTHGFITVVTLHPGTDTPETQRHTGGKLSSKCRKSPKAEKALSEEQAAVGGEEGPLPVPRRWGDWSVMQARSLQLRVPRRHMLPGRPGISPHSVGGWSGFPGVGLEERVPSRGAHGSLAQRLFQTRVLSPQWTGTEHAVEDRGWAEASRLRQESLQHRRQSGCLVFNPLCWWGSAISPDTCVLLGKRVILLQSQERKPIPELETDSIFMIFV